MIWKKSLLLVFGYALAVCTWTIGATSFAVGVLLGLGMIVAAFLMGRTPSVTCRILMETAISDTQLLQILPFTSYFELPLEPQATSGADHQPDLVGYDD